VTGSPHIRAVPGGGAAAGACDPGRVDDFLSARCSGFARAEGLDPAGTAGSYGGVVAVEMPLPWPREITEDPALVPVAPALAAAALRVQGLAPDPDRAPGDPRRMLTFLRPGGPFAGYRPAAWEVPAGDVTAALGALAAAAPGAGGDIAAAGPATLVAAGADVGRHVLVCTHGRRDACCGTLGTRLALALPGLGAGVRTWRTSHTGGHRFAPTAVLLPEGTAWAYLDPDSLVGIVDRTLDLDEAARRYRGCSGLDGPEVQAAEREALRSVGWGWLDRARTGTVVAREGARTLVRLDATGAGAAATAFEAVVEVARLVPVPECGKPPEEAPKSAPELRVASFAAA
jgi:hypothetical protein